MTDIQMNEQAAEKAEQAAGKSSEQAEQAAGKSSEQVEQTAAQAQDEQASREELKETLETRAKTYGLLARMFRKEADDALLKEMHAMRFRVSTGNAETDAGNKLIASYLSGLWENSQTELAADYMRVFFGHGYNAHAAAYPLESVYTSEKRLMMQDARDEVLALYRAAGLDKDEKWKESEDHIALELEYMQILAERTVSAFSENASDDDEALRLLRSQKNFMDEHLIGWIPMLTAEMLRFARTDFYKGLAHLLTGFIENDNELLEDLLTE